MPTRETIKLSTDHGYAKTMAVRYDDSVDYSEDGTDIIGPIWVENFGSRGGLHHTSYLTIPEARELGESLIKVADESDRKQSGLHGSQGEVWTGETTDK